MEGYINEHPSKVLAKVEELIKMGESSFKLATAKMKDGFVPQELIQL